MASIIINKEVLLEKESAMNDICSESREATYCALHAVAADETMDGSPDHQAIVTYYVDVCRLHNELHDIIKKVVAVFDETETDIEKKTESLNYQNDYIGTNIASIVNQGGSVSINTETGAIESVEIPERLNGYQGIPQHGNECTNISTAMLIQRYRLLHDPNYNNEYGYRGGPIDIHPEVEGWSTTMNNTFKDGHKYSTSGEYYGDLSQDGLADLLSKHHEGVVLYAHYAEYGRHSEGGAHAIVITRCERMEDGSLKFYALDPVNIRDDGPGEVELTSTHLYTGGQQHRSYGSIDQLLSNNIAYQYISEFN